jgi:transcriptional regulator with PAS, ATPase and Fis domain
MQRNGEADFPFPTIQTSSQRFRSQLQMARIATHSVSNTLISGETGSGKEVLARAIHAASDRREKPFIPIHIASIPRELLASELFGYADGAFTGAKKGGRMGKLEAANGGTLFLDEIGELTAEMQIVLLRVLEERKIIRLGDHEERSLDVRIIAATNRKLEKEIVTGRFRADLFYRLHVLHIQIPSLRERTEDIPYLVETFMNDLQTRYGKGPTVLSREVWDRFLEYAWPGNIRELRNVLERAFLLACEESSISAKHLPAEWNRSGANMDGTDSKTSILRELERETIQRALAQAKSVSAAAKQLGIARSTLYRKMSEWQMSSKK